MIFSKNTCILCLSITKNYVAGQDLSLCRGDVLSYVFECIEQVEYIYRRPRPRPNNGAIPCHYRCSKCRRCLLRQNINVPVINDTLWETVYRSQFVGENVTGEERTPDPDSDDSSSSDGDSRRKRSKFVRRNLRYRY